MKGLTAVVCAVLAAAVLGAVVGAGRPAQGGAGATVHALSYPQVTDGPSFLAMWGRASRDNTTIHAAISRHLTAAVRARSARAYRAALARLAAAVAAYTRHRTAVAARLTDAALPAGLASCLRPARAHNAGMGQIDRGLHLLLRAARARDGARMASIWRGLRRIADRNKGLSIDLRACIARETTAPPATTPPGTVEVIASPRVVAQAGGTFAPLPVWACNPERAPCSPNDAICNLAGGGDYLHCGWTDPSSELRQQARAFCRLKGTTDPPGSATSGYRVGGRAEPYAGEAPGHPARWGQVGAETRWVNVMTGAVGATDDGTSFTEIACIT